VGRAIRRLRVRTGVECRVSAFLAVILLGAETVVPTQGTGRHSTLENTAGTFRAAVDLVTLNVAVADGKNRPVSGLVRNDFRVLEDGVAQDVSFFAASEVPVDVVLLVDSSSSVSPSLHLIKQASAGFIESLRPIDRAAVMSFTTQLRIVQHFTANRRDLLDAVQGLGSHGDTALYTALYVALDHLERSSRNSTVDASSFRRQAVVALTDGRDTTSVIGFDGLLDRARRVGVPVYVIRLQGSADLLAWGHVDRRAAERADYEMMTLARETGGRAFFPVQVDDLDGVYRLVEEDLSNQYQLGYVPKLERRDGSYRRISVQITTRLDVRPRTRTGYFSPGPTRVSR
jgi:Ca-activated chloride channel homolog